MVELTSDLTPDEFKQYYFLKEQLKDFCRSNNLKVSGSKQELENRIIHYLATGEKLSEPSKKSVKSSSGEIGLNAKLGENFKCSEDKRAFFEKEIGKGFKFKVNFQKWIKSNPDKTYADAIEAYYDLQNSKQKTTIGKQFQYNQFIRDFFEDNEDRSLDDAIKCWKYKKSLKGHNRYEKSDLVAL